MAEHSKSGQYNARAVLQRLGLGYHIQSPLVSRYLPLGKIWNDINVHQSTHWVAYPPRSGHILHYLHFASKVLPLPCVRKSTFPY